MKSYKFHTKKNHVEVELTIQTPKEMKNSIKQQVIKFKNWLHSPKRPKRYNKLFEIEIETEKTHKKWGI
ncbi:hypothetical protein LMB49_10875 [Limosilactobacillus reuteri]|uniref:hypothetical protein n=1 Tax=Limosilactobacillus reuteri TaxID=1598 RepID=UPI001E3CF430|nr:hypothetical protein [Limosilactobacillus reuteri]MCC4371893.1 hypothetical protein [Limosilactobacillus reuteri]MCC4509628.1 hypothetical protein [Limosilactobacillus reuteri]